ncbi:hypothetical protein [Desulfovibrio subterraneus]|uniref:Uncharacterized protein n=1 Tax=Desulfovibrio subterraneus TaxID=2718620 RepID=A0A7J0BHX1_9BACT|nr:hypothetical protein [Desulfovibrio subterraneus]GFM33266.1 hypothetical protein DSM101010T_16310 [Desulfovibrio subterraneus]
MGAAQDFLESGEGWSCRVARLALPILIATAQCGQKITYKQLAEELCERHGEVIKRRMTIYGYPVGRIGWAMEMLSKEWGEQVPPINALVVNAATGLPGDGVNQFIVQFLKPRARKRQMAPKAQKAFKEQAVQRVWDYSYWDQVAEYFAIPQDQLEPARIVGGDDGEEIGVPPVGIAGGHGESKLHKGLKEWAARNPKHFAEFGKFSKGVTEYPLHSGDSLDVFLRGSEGQLAVEVKASNAPVSELYRGVFQCVKYRATMRAMLLAASEIPAAQAVLLTTLDIPDEVKRLARRLEVRILSAPLSAENG